MLKARHTDGSLILATWNETLLVAIFRGAMTQAQFVVAQPIAYEAVRAAHDGGALLTIFEPSAFEADEQSRATAARMIEDAGRVLRAVAIVYEAGGAASRALVERSRDVLTRSETEAQVKGFETVTPAAAWVLETARLARTQGDASKLADAIAGLRAPRAQ